MLVSSLSTNGHLKCLWTLPGSLGKQHHPHQSHCSDPQNLTFFSQLDLLPVPCRPLLCPPLKSSPILLAMGGQITF
jgi:hypothetical protein